MISRRESGSSGTDESPKEHLNKRTGTFEASFPEYANPIKKKRRKLKEERQKAGFPIIDDSSAPDSSVPKADDGSCALGENMPMNQSSNTSHLALYPSSMAQAELTHSLALHPHLARTNAVPSSDGSVPESFPQDVELMTLLRQSTASLPTNFYPAFNGSLSSLALPLLSPLHLPTARYPFTMPNSIPLDIGNLTSGRITVPQQSHIDSNAFNPYFAPYNFLGPTYTQDMLQNSVAATRFHMANATTMPTFPGVDATALLSLHRSAELAQTYPIQIPSFDQVLPATARSQDFSRVPTAHENNSVLGRERISANSSQSLPVAFLESSLAINHNSEARQRFSESQSTGSSIRESCGDGVILACPEDRGMLNDHLIFLRHQLEFFQATVDDVMSFTRGRNKGIARHQVGIRCRHCSHVPVDNRRKGSTYFPSNLMGIYQAAQNIGVEHLQSGVCPEMSPDVQEKLMRTKATKTANSGAGKAYWAESARTIGLIDTDDGIRFAGDEAKSEILPTSTMI